MAYEICSIGPDDLGELARAVSTAFGDTMSDEALEDEQLVIEYDRMLGVADSGQFVAGAGAYSFEHTLPGNTLVPGRRRHVGGLPARRIADAAY